MGPRVIAFEANDEVTLLPVVTDRAARKAARLLKISARAAGIEICLLGRRSPAAALDPDIKAGPIEQALHRVRMAW